MMMSENYLRISIKHVSRGVIFELQMQRCKEHLVDGLQMGRLSAPRSPSHAEKREGARVVCSSEFFLGNTQQ